MSEFLEGTSRDREQRLKEIVKDLHEGSDIKVVRKRFADLIRNVSPEEIAAMEQALIAEGVPVLQVQKLCDVHVQVFEEAEAKGVAAIQLDGKFIDYPVVERSKRILKLAAAIGTD